MNMGIFSRKTWFLANESDEPWYFRIFKRTWCLSIFEHIGVLSATMGVWLLVCFSGEPRVKVWEGEDVGHSHERRNIFLDLVRMWLARPSCVTRQPGKVVTSPCMVGHILTKMFRAYCQYSTFLIVRLLWHEIVILCYWIISWLHMSNR